MLPSFSSVIILSSLYIAANYFSRECDELLYLTLPLPLVFPNGKMDDFCFLFYSIMDKHVNVYFDKNWYF